MWELLKTYTKDWKYWGQNSLDINWSTAYMGAFKDF